MHRSRFAWRNATVAHRCRGRILHRFARSAVSRASGGERAFLLTRKDSNDTHGTGGCRSRAQHLHREHELPYRRPRVFQTALCAHSR